MESRRFFIAVEVALLLVFQIPAPFLAMVSKPQANFHEQLPALLELALLF